MRSEQEKSKPIKTKAESILNCLNCNDEIFGNFCSSCNSYFDLEEDFWCFNEKHYCLTCEDSLKAELIKIKRVLGERDDL